MPHALDNAWKGERCFIIGGGDSGTDVPLDLFKGERVITAGYCIFRYQSVASIAYCIDTDFWNIITHPETGLTEFTGLPICNKPDPQHRNFHGLRVVHDGPGWAKSFSEPMKPYLRSGTGAINIAEMLGCSVAYLIGFDGYGGNSIGNYIRKGEGSGRQSDEAYDPYIEQMHGVAGNDMSIDVINLSPKSRIECFPQMGVFEWAHEERNMGKYARGSGYYADEWQSIVTQLNNRAMNVK